MSDVLGSSGIEVDTQEAAGEGGLEGCTARHYFRIETLAIHTCIRSVSTLLGDKSVETRQTAGHRKCHRCHSSRYLRQSVVSREKHGLKSREENSWSPWSRGQSIRHVVTRSIGNSAMTWGGAREERETALDQSEVWSILMGRLLEQKIVTILA
ncbi:hypothetical protein J6590_065510 [Homalodisca vitripennis]|nr:hypothetical protein J6590_065510 [Homalodisca vitripennis]